MTTIEKACEAEIVRIHEFFVAWFTGSIPNTDEEFYSGIERQFSSSFHLIPPSGSKIPYKTLIESLRNAYGIHAKGNFSIEIKNCQPIYQQESTSTVAMTYEEWQHTKMTTTENVDGVNNTKITSRISTAIFDVVGNEKVQDVELKWMHVHETWMPKRNN